MVPLLDQPLHAIVRADDGAPPLSTASEILLKRVTALVYKLVQRAPQSAVTDAASSGSDATLLQELAGMLATESAAPDAWTRALIRGKLALAECLAATGGVWQHDEALEHCRVTRQTLQQWRATRKVLALARHDRTFSYPVGQFRRPMHPDDAARPYPGVKQVCDLTKGRMKMEELVAFLATPQPMLAREHGQARTAFDTWAAGDDATVRALLEWYLTPADTDAPRLRID